MTERLRLGELLVDMGLISRAQLEGALAKQAELSKNSEGRGKRRIGELLVLEGLVSESQVTQVLSQQLSVPWVSLQHIDFSRQLLNLVPAQIAEEYGLVPIYVRRARNRQETLYVAMEDPSDDGPLELISRHSGLPVRAMIAPPSDIKGAIRAYYLGLPPEEGEPGVEDASPHSLADVVPLRSMPPPAPLPPGVEAASAADAPPDSDEPKSGPLWSRDSAMPKPAAPEGAAARMVTLTMLDGTTITLPRAGPAERGGRSSVGPSVDLTARDLIEALRAQAEGADASQVFGEGVTWESMFSALLSLLLKKHLIHDWEFVRELRR